MGLNAKPLSLNQILKIYVLAERSAASMNNSLDHLCSRINLGVLSLSPILWSHMSTWKWERSLADSAPSLTLSHPPPHSHSPPSLSTKKGKEKKRRKRRKRRIQQFPKHQEHLHLHLYPWWAQELSPLISWNHLSNPRSQSLHAWMKHGAWWSLHHLKGKIKVTTSSTT